MVKKKGGKKKGGKKKDKKLAGKKTGISALDKEIFLLKIRDLENKIAWKKRLCKRISDGIYLHQTAYGEENSKTGAIKRLEEAIREQVATNEGYRDAIRNVGSEGCHADMDNMAAGFRNLDELKDSYDEEMRVLRNELRSLETFNPHKLERKIDELRVILESEDTMSLLNSVELDRRREEYFREVLPQILEEQALQFQENLKGRLDPKFNRIVEETRWRRMGLDDMVRISTKLEAKNEALQKHLESERKNLASRKEVELQASARLQVQKRLVSSLEQKNSELDRQETVVEDQKKETQHYSDLFLEMYNDVQELKKQNRDCVEKLKDNERMIREEVERFSEEVEFGRFLSEALDRVQKLVEEEVMRPLVVSYNGGVPEKNLLEELDSLLEKTSKAIYDLEPRCFFDEEKDEEPDDAVEYLEFGTYEMGSLGLVPESDYFCCDDGDSAWESEDDSSLRADAKAEPKEFDSTAAKILSGMGLLSRFEKKSRHSYTLRKYRLRGYK